MRAGWVGRQEEDSGRLEVEVRGNQKRYGTDFLPSHKGGGVGRDKHEGKKGVYA